MTLIRFVNREEVAAAASSEEHKGGKLIGRSVWGKALNMMLIAHPPQFAFRANYRKAKCEMIFLPLLSLHYLLVPQGIKKRGNPSFSTVIQVLKKAKLHERVREMSKKVRR